MPEQVLPVFCDGVTEINAMLSFKKENGMVYYFHGAFPIFSHADDDHRSFKFYTSQLIASGMCRNIEIQRAFGVTKISVCRNLKRFQEGGVAAFFRERRRRGCTIMTPEVLSHAQELLDEGLSRSETATELGVKTDTLSKAVHAGKLLERPKKKMISR